MIPVRIKMAIENNPELNEQLLAAGMGLDWTKFNRTVFDFLARRINKKVTQQIAAHPSLLTEQLVLGKNQLEKLIGEQPLTDEVVVSIIANQRKQFNWISGKTLQSYWKKGKAKDTRLNVLLSYLEVAYADWDDWKNSMAPTTLLNKQIRSVRKSNNQSLLKNYFLGSYFLYYQKSDNSRILVKAPFVIGVDERGNIFSQTLTEGHPYQSSTIELRDGILYIHFENQLFDEKENHIFNVGNETNPEVLFGVSNTISVKKRLAIGIRNLLVKQKQAFTEATYLEKEIPFDAEGKLTKEELTVLKYFNQQSINLINSLSCCPFSVLEAKVKT
jgi:hypothetical protein